MTTMSRTDVGEFPTDTLDTASHLEVITPREVPLGGLRAMTVRRTLPNRQRTTIGPWCFLDHYGPDPVADTGGMNVAPHPHTGLQTVSWLFEGRIHHRDSTGSDAFVTPGELHLMTAGGGYNIQKFPPQRPPPCTGCSYGWHYPMLPATNSPILMFAHHCEPRWKAPAFT